jgi:hypothetical protein
MLSGGINVCGTLYIDRPRNTEKVSISCVCKKSNTQMPRLCGHDCPFFGEPVVYDGIMIGIELCEGQIVFQLDKFIDQRKQL